MWYAKTTAEPQGSGSAPWLITFVDMISLLLTFMVAIYASADIADPVWRPAAAVLRAAFNDEPPPPSAADGAAAAGLKPGYLALVLGESLAHVPLFASSRPVYDADALSLTLPTATVFADGTMQPEAAAAVDLSRFAGAVASVADAVVVTVPPDPPAGAGELSAAADWEGAIARALSLGRVLTAGGLPESRLSLLAGGAGSRGDGIRIVLAPERQRR